MDTVSKLFQTQYEEYDNLVSETSCARIDHQYFDKKLIKGDNKKVEDAGKFQYLEKMEVRESVADIERSHVKTGKTLRQDVSEETLPDRKRHKSENHRDKHEDNDSICRDGRKRHRTTSDASGFAKESERMLTVKSNVDADVSADKKHKSSHKLEHKIKRKDKHEKVGHIDKEKDSSHRNKASDGDIAGTRAENFKPNKDITKYDLDLKWKNEAGPSKVKDKDKTMKKPEKESILSKLEASLKSFRKSKKENTERKKSDTSKKHKSLR